MFGIRVVLDAKICKSFSKRMIFSSEWGSMNICVRSCAYHIAFAMAFSLQLQDRLTLLMLHLGIFFTPAPPCGDYFNLTCRHKNPCHLEIWVFSHVLFWSKVKWLLQSLESSNWLSVTRCLWKFAKCYPRDLQRALLKSILADFWNAECMSSSPKRLIASDARPRPLVWKLLLLSSNADIRDIASPTSFRTPESLPMLIFTDRNLILY